MIPTYMTSSPFPFDLNYSSADQYDDDGGDHQNPKLFFTSSSNYQAAASSSSNNNHSSSSSHLFLNYDPQFYQPPAPNANDNWGSYDMEAKKGQAETGHNKWRKEEEKYENEGEKSPEKVMMMPAKLKLVKKVRSSSDRANMEVVTNNVSATKIIEDHHQKGPSLSSSLETDHSSHSSSSNNGGNGNNVPIVRVCADCNTTKTPLWRSGPKGPKSLCNACGIRQRKARRAMAAAAAANGGANGTAPSSSPSTLKLKVQKTTAAKSNNNYPSHHQQPLKKRCKFVTAAATATAEASSAAPPSSNDAAKNGVEDFLKKLSNSLALHRVFPQDEKDAAILLMAISCGLVHG